MKFHKNVLRKLRYSVLKYRNSKAISPLSLCERAYKSGMNINYKA